MARRPAGEIIERYDPMQGAVDSDRENIAAVLEEALSLLSNVDQGTIKGILYRIPVPNGKYEWIRDVYPPFDMSEIMRSLKEDIGGGDYALRIMAEGKVRKTIHFSIMKDKMPLVADKVKDDSMTMMMFQMMMQQSRDASQQRMEDMRERQAASERQMTMIVGLASAALPIIMGGKDKTSEVMAALGPYINRKEDDSTEKTLALLKNAKELFGGNSSDEKGDDMQEMVASGVKLIGPALKGLGDMVSRGRGAAPTGAADASREPMAEVPALMLPQGETPLVHASKYPILDLIRADVLYFFARNHDPEKTADMVYDIIEQHDVSDEAINELAAAFAISPDWMADLAQEGIELRSRPDWAEKFLTALISIHAGIDGTDDDTERGAGSLSDAREDGAASAQGDAKSVNP